MGAVRVNRNVCRASVVFVSGRAKVESDDPSLHGHQDISF